MVKYITIKNYIPLVISFLFLMFLINYCVINPVSSSHQPAALADSFLKGYLYITDTDQMYDTAEYNGLKYWPLGPFPAVLLTPLIFLFSNYFVEDYISIIITLITFVIIIGIANKIGFGQKDSLYWALAFCTGTSYFFLSFMPNGWYFPHIVNSLLLFLAFYVFLNKRNYIIIGIIIGLILMTRLPSAAIVLFFFLHILFDTKSNIKTKIKDLSKLCLPVILSLSILGIYNYARFDNVFEQGYSLQNMPNPALKAARDDYGLLSYRHIPGNIYYMFISTPSPVFTDDITHVLRFPYVTSNPWGISIFITSLWLFKIFTLRFKGRQEYLILFAVTITLLLILLFCGTGFWQIGYRYALDFIPSLFVVFMIAYNRQEGNLSNGMKLLICLSFILNSFLFFTHV